MTFDPNDPRLTAYALGELETADREAVDAMLGGDAESRKFVDELRETARLLTEQFKTEATPGLTAEHREAIHQSIDARPAVLATLPRTSTIRWRPILSIAAAASLLAITSTLLLSTNRARERGTTVLARAGRKRRRRRCRPRRSVPR